MTLASLCVLYGLVGAGLAAWRLRRPPRSGAVQDAALLALLWPLYGPFCTGQAPRASAEALDERLQRARARAAEIDALLATPDFDAAAATDQVEALLATGQTQAAQAARQVLANIERLRALRRRYAEELAVVEALQHQLRTQLEVLRVSGQAQEGLDELVSTLEARVTGLEAVLEEPLLAA